MNEDWRVLLKAVMENVNIISKNITTYYVHFFPSVLDEERCVLFYFFLNCVLFQLCRIGPLVLIRIGQCWPGSKFPVLVTNEFSISQIWYQNNLL